MTCGGGVLTIEPVMLKLVHVLKAIKASLPPSDYTSIPALTRLRWSNLQTGATMALFLHGRNCQNKHTETIKNTTHVPSSLFWKTKDIKTCSSLPGQRALGSSNPTTHSQSASSVKTEHSPAHDLFWAFELYKIFKSS